MNKLQFEYLSGRLEQIEHKVNELESMFRLEEYFSVPDIASSLKVNTITIQRKITNGEIEAVKIGREYRISKTSIEQYLKNLSTKK